MGLANYLSRNKVISLLLALMIFLILAFVPTYSKPVASISGRDWVLLYWPWDATIKIKIPSGEILSPFDIAKVCLISDSGEEFCAESFSIVHLPEKGYGYGYYYVPNWEQHSFYGYGYGYSYYGWLGENYIEIKARFRFKKLGTYKFVKVKVYNKEGKYVSVDLESPISLRVIFIRRTTVYHTTPSVSVEKVKEKLKEEGIKEIIEKEVPVEEIKEVKVEVYKVGVKLPEKKELERVKEKLEEVVEKTVGKKVKVEVKVAPVEKVEVKVIKIVTKTGKTKVYTKVEKIVKSNRVIEVVPKNVAKKAEEVIWLKGKVEVIEEDPIFEVEPEEYTYAYLIPGNKSEEIKGVETLVYTYKEVKEEVTKSEEVPKEEKPIENITKKLVGEKKKLNYWPIIVLVFIGILVGAIVYLMKSRRIMFGKKV